MLRSCYETDMQFYTDPAQPTTRIRWFFTDQPFIPYYNLFSSSEWRSDRNVSWDGVGEVAGAHRRWANGANPTSWPGVCTCGNAGAWTAGVANPGISPPLVPLGWVVPCCVPPAFCSVTGWNLDVSRFLSGGSVIAPGMTGAGSSGVCQWSSARIANVHYWTLQIDPMDSTLILGSILFHPAVGADVLIGTFSGPVSRVGTGLCQHTDYLVTMHSGGEDPGSFVRLHPV
jgi:hypothetical protein